MEVLRTPVSILHNVLRNYYVRVVDTATCLSDTKINFTVWLHDHLQWRSVFQHRHEGFDDDVQSDVKGVECSENTLPLGWTVALHQYWYQTLCRFVDHVLFQSTLPASSAYQLNKFNGRTARTSTVNRSATARPEILCKFWNGLSLGILKIRAFFAILGKMVGAQSSWVLLMGLSQLLSWASPGQKAFTCSFKLFICTTANCLMPTFIVITTCTYIHTNWSPLVPPLFVFYSITSDTPLTIPGFARVM